MIWPISAIARFFKRKPKLRIPTDETDNTMPLCLATLDDIQAEFLKRQMPYVLVCQELDTNIHVRHNVTCPAAILMTAAIGLKEQGDSD
jgi:hypothetical protein